MIYLWLTGIPAVIIGIVAAISPFTYDMNVLLQEDLQCGSLQFILTFNRDRSVIYIYNFIVKAGLKFWVTFKINPHWSPVNGVGEGQTPLGISFRWSLGQTDRQAVASGRKLNLRIDLRWVAKRLASFLASTRNSQKKDNLRQTILYFIGW